MAEATQPVVSKATVQISAALKEAKKTYLSQYWKNHVDTYYNRCHANPKYMQEVETKYQNICLQNSNTVRLSAEPYMYAAS